MTRSVPIPGPRRARGSLDAPVDSPPACVVACPPHPQHGGSRSDPRLRAVSDGLGERDIACLRIDYGPWDEGRGEQTDARNALAWAREEFGAVGLFGYSFGGAVGLCATAAADAQPEAVAALAPPASLVADRDVVDAIGAIDCPVQVLVGDRDATVDSGPVADRARDRGASATVEVVPGGHHFAGHHDRVAQSIADFIAAALGAGS